MAVCFVAAVTMGYLWIALRDLRHLQAKTDDEVREIRTREEAFRNALEYWENRVAQMAVENTARTMETRTAGRKKPKKDKSESRPEPSSRRSIWQHRLEDNDL